jgi:hypothetical protein
MPLNARRSRLLGEALGPLLMAGERVELLSLTSVGTVSAGRRIATAAVVGVLTAGTVTAVVRPRPMYLAVTDQRLLLFDAAHSSGRPGNLLANLPRPYVTASGPRKGMLGLVSVVRLTVEGSERDLKLTFPVMTRRDGGWLTSVLPPTR